MTAEPLADPLENAENAGAAPEPMVALVPVEQRLAIAAPLPRARHPAMVYLARLAPGSRRTMTHSLDTIAAMLSGGQAHLGTLPWHELRYEHTALVRAALAERYAAATANKMASALRGVLKEAWRLGLMDAEDYRRAVDIQGVRGNALPAGRALSAGELRTLFADCSVDARPAGVRDAALLAVLYGAGLRRAEAAALNLAHYDAEEGALTVRGKGNKKRRAYLAGGAAEALEAWLALRHAVSLTPTPTGPFFLPITKGGRFVVRRMTEQAIFYILRRRARAAGIRDFSPHDCRRTFIGDLLDAGADISTVQRLAGHANVQTTARYDRRGERVKRQAAALLHVPYPVRRHEE